MKYPICNICSLFNPVHKKTLPFCNISVNLPLDIFVLMCYNNYKYISLLSMVFKKRFMFLLGNLPSVNEIPIVSFKKGTWFIP